MEPKYPKVHVKLVGEDGNAFFILAKVVLELQKAGVSKQEVKEFLDEAKAGNYDHLLQTVMRWVDAY